MTGSTASYSLKRSAHFERTLKAHLKELPKRQQPEALELFGAILELLTVQPRQQRGQALPALEKMGPEPWPGATLAGDRRGNFSIGGWEFWKVYINFPYLKGAARKGRVMYAIDETGRTVHLLMLYTHAEYQGRPDDAYLEGVMRESGVPPRE